MAQASDYPVQLSIDYPESSNRLTAFFRPILMIPIVILSIGVTYALVMLTLPVALIILFRRKYPRWWFDFNLEVLRFSTRINAYAGLMQDAYPSTDEDQSVHLDIEYPDDLNRWLPLIKWLLAIPHYIVLMVLGLVSLVLTVIAWFAILITGRFPRALFDFNLGVSRWEARVSAYMSTLMTDRYPPFSLSP
jgi:hypothetical protein